MRRRWLPAGAVGLLAALVSTSTPGQIFKCPVNGVQVYQQAPCAGLGDSGGRLMIRQNGQAVAAPPAPPERAAPIRVLGKTRLPTPTAGNKP
jgi:hypothetical protein